MNGSTSSYGICAERQGLEDVEAHHRADVGVLDQDDLALCGLDLERSW